MELIRELGRDPIWHKKTALFKCPVCGKEVVKDKAWGKKAGSCSSICSGIKKSKKKQMKATRPYEVEGCGDPWENLANAVIEQAVMDWFYAMEAEKKAARLGKSLSSSYGYCGQSVQGIEAFFKSDWFNTFSKLDGEVLLDEIKKAYSRGTLKYQNNVRGRRKS